MERWDVCFKDWTDVFKKLGLRKCEMWLRKRTNEMCVLRTGLVC